MKNLREWVLLSRVIIIIIIIIIINVYSDLFYKFHCNVFVCFSVNFDRKRPIPEDYCLIYLDSGMPISRIKRFFYE